MNSTKAAITPTPVLPLVEGMHLVWFAGPMQLRDDLQNLGLEGIFILGASREKFSANAPIKFGVAVADESALLKLSRFYIEWHVMHPTQPLSDINGQAPSSNEADWEDWVVRIMRASRTL